MRWGFTLIELMVVIVIIGILAAVVIAVIGEKPDEVKWKITQVSLKGLRSELELFNTNHNRYPQDLEELVTGRYREEKPLDGWNRPIVYRVPGHDGRPFELVSYAADGQPGGTGWAADIWVPPRK